MKNYIKILDLPFWADIKRHGIFASRESVAECCKGSVLPIFNRDGYYYDRKTKACWIETNGMAFQYDAASFLWDWKILMAEDVIPRKVCIDALYVLEQARLLSKEQKEMLRRYRHIMDLKSVGRNATRSVMKILKKPKYQIKRTRRKLP